MLRSLPLEQREVIVAHLWGGLTFEQIGDFVGLLVEHGSPVLRRWAFRDPGTIGGHMPQIPPDPELKAIESALGELIPLSSRLDRDKLMFQAGAMSKAASSRSLGLAGHRDGPFRRPGRGIVVAGEPPCRAGCRACRLCAGA